MRQVSKTTMTHLRGVDRIAVFTAVATLSLAASAAPDEYATAAEMGLMQGFPPPADKMTTRNNSLLSGPYNRWSYLNMRMLYPAAGIAAAQKPVRIDRDIEKNRYTAGGAAGSSRQAQWQTGDYLTKSSTTSAVS